MKIEPIAISIILTTLSLIMASKYNSQNLQAEFLMHTLGRPFATVTCDCGAKFFHNKGPFECMPCQKKHAQQKTNGSMENSDEILNDS